ncbi:hypothetical protein [Nocardiopsis sp. CC223A]|uniref:hypothetical protein n=1 Tax=Nocardiopsis sp. CC223A TaxID=3044051 RepID=UPI002795DDD7|nr:hypothetical protein [Nocardiopsis sp. CC223A]
MRWWKVLGAAAFVGVAATGVAIARAERQRRAYTPDQVRDRLRDRMAQVSVAAEQAPDQEVPPEAEQGPVRTRPSRFARRVRALAARSPIRFRRSTDPEG